MARQTKREVITESTGNVFADLGFENPEEELAKAKLVFAISKTMASKGLTQAQLAEVICLDQPQVSRLLRGQTGGYSTDRLIRILNLLGQDVEIHVAEKPTNADRPAQLFVISPFTQESAIQSVAEPRRRYGKKSQDTD